MAEDKKNSVKVGVMNEPKSENPNGAEVLKQAASAEKVKAAPGVPGILISSIDHPEMVKYGNEVVRMSPRARQSVDDISKLPSQLPPGIHLKK